MNRSLSIFAVGSALFALMSIGGCTDKGTLPQPLVTNPNLISNSSFERDGEPTLEGWVSADSRPGSIESLHAPGGGLYSLRLGYGTIGPAGRFSTPVCEARGGEVFHLSAFVRGIGGGNAGGWIGLSVGDWSSTNGKMSRCSDTFWAQISVVDTIDQDSPDSVQVWLGALRYGCTDRSAGDGLFDLVRLERIEP